MYEPDLPGEAPLRAYLELAEHYYHEDRLDLAMKVVNDSFEHAGWQPGGWTAFYNEIVCEKDARDESDPLRVDELLTLEVPRSAPAEVLTNTRDATLEARNAVAELLRVEWTRPVMVTVFLPDAAVDFIVGSYGYVSHKTTLDKICLPYDVVTSRREALDALTHEFTHVATFELAHGQPPEWFDEGLATYLSGELKDRQSRFVISTAARTGRMLSLGRIEGVLNDPDERKDNPEMVSAAYLLSGSFIEHWAREHGMESVRKALALLAGGDSIDRAVREATGESLRRMEEQWRSAILRGGPAA